MVRAVGCGFHISFRIHTVRFFFLRCGYGAVRIVLSRTIRYGAARIVFFKNCRVRCGAVRLSFQMIVSCVAVERAPTAVEKPVCRRFTP